VDAGFTVARVNGSGPERLVVVRPDGYVCAVLADDAPDRVRAAVRQALVA